MMNKATHQGHCQACGRLQRLPNGLLAKHGYKVTSGYFSGVCVGSGHQPFEKSYEMLPGFIASAERERANIEARQTKLRTPLADDAKPMAWVNNYEGKVYAFGNHYIWRKVELKAEAVDWSTDYMKAYYTAPGAAKSGWSKERDENKRHDLYEGIHLRGGLLTEAKALRLRADHLNDRFAEAMEPAAEDLRRYIKWQQNRIATWTEQPLRPVADKPVAKEERKVEFKPTAEVNEAAE